MPIWCSMQYGTISREELLQLCSSQAMVTMLRSSNSGLKRVSTARLSHRRPYKVLNPTQENWCTNVYLEDVKHKLWYGPNEKAPAWTYPCKGLSRGD